MGQEILNRCRLRKLEYTWDRQVYCAQLAWALKNWSRIYPMGARAAIKLFCAYWNIFLCLRTLREVGFI